MPSYNSVSTLAVKAYKPKGFHTPLQGSITGCLLTLAAVLFVDDTDLFLSADSEQSDEEFIRKIQGHDCAGNRRLSKAKEVSGCPDSL